MKQIDEANVMKKIYILKALTLPSTFNHLVPYINHVTFRYLYTLTN